MNVISQVSNYMAVNGVFVFDIITANNTNNQTDSSHCILTDPWWKTCYNCSQSLILVPQLFSSILLCFSCDPDFFQRVCTSISVKSRQEVQQLVSLLKLLDFTLQLTGELNRKTCRTVGRVLGLCSSNVDLILTPRKVSVRGASLLFRPSTQLHSLRYTVTYLLSLVL